MVHLSRSVAFTLIIVACALLSALAQRPPDIPLSPQINREVVANTIKAIDKYYLSEDVARQLNKGLDARLAAGGYDQLTSAFDLIDALDEHMQGISHDRHLAMLYSHEGGPPVKEVGDNIKPETPEDRAESLTAARRNNYGFEKVARLSGNVGLLELNRFVRPEFSGEAAGNAMSLLANTDALIIDLRKSHGGSPDMVVFLASYFFPGDECYHLGDWHTRIEGREQQLWTYAYVPGERFLNKPVYILTARQTFSAPEGLAALLQHHKKAIVVGEQTAGGTHPVVMVRVHSNFAVNVPVSMMVYPTGEPTSPLNRPIYPERKPDTAGTGVTPDIDAPAGQALTAAHRAALERIIEKYPDRKEELQRVIEKLKPR